MEPTENGDVRARQPHRGGERKREVQGEEGSEFRRAKRGKSEDIVDKAVFLTRDNEDAI